MRLKSKCKSQKHIFAFIFNKFHYIALFFSFIFLPVIVKKKKSVLFSETMLLVRVDGFGHGFFQDVDELCLPRGWRSSEFPSLWDCSIRTKPLLKAKKSIQISYYVSRCRVVRREPRQPQHLPLLHHLFHKQRLGIYYLTSCPVIWFKGFRPVGVL